MDIASTELTARGRVDAADAGDEPPPAAVLAALPAPVRVVIERWELLTPAEQAALAALCAAFVATMNAEAKRGPVPQ